jgi:hypothetical protein
MNAPPGLGPEEFGPHIFVVIGPQVKCGAGGMQAKSKNQMGITWIFGLHGLKAFIL